MRPLVVTPEYNGSIPAVVKNAIDWLSCPFGNGVLKDKPLAVIGAFGRYGGTWAHDETRKSFGIAGRGSWSRSNYRCRSAAWTARRPPSTRKLVANVREALGKLTAEVG